MLHDFLFFFFASSNENQGPWTEEEDALLEGYVAEFGPSWAAVAEKMKTRSADR